MNLNLVKRDLTKFGSYKKIVELLKLLIKIWYDKQ